jgi:SAM-dependent methyltransferase
MSQAVPLDNTPRARRMIQTICDLTRRPLTDCRILDLACAHGQYSIEFARRGAAVLGIEGRAEWLRQANSSKQSTGITTVDFVQDDVRNLSVAKYGTFDIILCLGILYHLDAADVFDFLLNVSNLCRDFAIIDTQIALRPETYKEWHGEKYWGWIYQEHPAAATAETKLATLGASLDNERSFWLTRSSLLNALRHVGFTSVLECRNPIDNMYSHGEFKLHADYVTMVALKGRPVGDFFGMNPAGNTEENWPENPSDYFLERPWSHLLPGQSLPPRRPRRLAFLRGIVNHFSGTGN